MLEPGMTVRDITNGRMGEVIDWAGPHTVWVLWDDNHRANRVSVWKLTTV